MAKSTPSLMMNKKKSKTIKISIPVEVGAKLEAKDYCGVWYSSKIRDVDEENQEILIHFEGWSSRYDEWIDLKSSRLRPAVRASRRKVPSVKSHVSQKEWQSGDHVLARWSDTRYYPGKIIEKKSNGLYEVLYDDGVKKLCLPSNIKDDDPKKKVSSNSVNNDKPLESFSTRNSGSKISNNRKSRSQRVSDSSLAGANGVDPVSEGESNGNKRNFRENTRSYSNIHYIRTPSSTSSSSPSNMNDIYKRHKRRQSRSISSSGNVATFQPTPKKRLKKAGIDEIASKLIDLAKSKQNDLLCDANISEAGGEKDSHTADTTPSIFNVELDQEDVPDLGDFHIKLRNRESDTKTKQKAQNNNKNESIEQAFNAVSYKCTFLGCNKSFRKEAALESHCKHYHSDIKKREVSSKCVQLAKSKNKRPASVSDARFSDGTIKRRRTSAPASLESSSASGSKFSISRNRSDSIYNCSDQEQDIVRCICGKSEEFGFMLQCEKCFTWQHTECIEVDNKKIPPKYTCYVCLAPPGLRQRGRFRYRSNWPKTGMLASLSIGNSDENYKNRTQLLLRCGDLMRDMDETSYAAHGQWWKLCMASNEEHPDFVDFICYPATDGSASIRYHNHASTLCTDSDCVSETKDMRQSNVATAARIRENNDQVFAKFLTSNDRTGKNYGNLEREVNSISESASCNKKKTGRADTALEVHLSTMTNGVDDIDHVPSSTVPCLPADKISLEKVPRAVNDNYVLGSSTNEGRISDNSLPVWNNLENVIFNLRKKDSPILKQFGLLLGIGKVQNQMSNRLDAIESDVHDLGMNPKGTDEVVNDFTNRYCTSFENGYIQTDIKPFSYRATRNDHVVSSSTSCGAMSGYKVSSTLDHIRTVVIDGNRNSNDKLDSCRNHTRWLKLRRTIQDLQWLKLLAAVMNEPFK